MIAKADEKSQRGPADLAGGQKGTALARPCMKRAGWSNGQKVGLAERIVVRILERPALPALGDAERAMGGRVPCEESPLIE